MRVAVILGPWLETPPTGYGGIEVMVNVLLRELKQAGVHSELFTIAGSTAAAEEKHWFYEHGHYGRLNQEINDVVHIPVSHLGLAIDIIEERGYFDIVHDHTGMFLSFLAWRMAKPPFPPILYTLHGPAPAELSREYEVMLRNSNQLYMNAISHSQFDVGIGWPDWLIDRLSQPPVIHNGIDLDDYPFVAHKGDYWVSISRINQGKSQHRAAEFCRQLGEPLKIAGSLAEGDKPYFAEKLQPLLGGGIEYLRQVSAEEKVSLLQGAKGFLFPIDWEEPFGVAPIEAMACGTPVVAMARGALPEIIQHGVNGFLAKSEDEFVGYMQKIDQIDPQACRRSVELQFSGRVMAENYLKAYEYAIWKHKKGKDG